MERDAIWQAFSDTGDPMYYLLYKATRDIKPQKEKITRTDRLECPPQPED